MVMKNRIGYNPIVNSASCHNCFGDTYGICIEGKKFYSAGAADP
jgi:hypothetical protein